MGKPTNLFCALQYLHSSRYTYLWLKCNLKTALLSGGGCPGCLGLPLLAKPALRQRYAPMAGKPVYSSRELPPQWDQAPDTLIYHWKK